MKKIELDDLKKIQIEILNYIDTFCKSNDIKYWLDSGTLLGAVRHKGYIPWDDDIDIGMLRGDYEKFIKSFKDDNNKYMFECYENDKKCPFTYGKVLDLDTIMYEPDEKTGVKSSVFVDVFPYDNIPDQPDKRKKILKKRDIYKKMNSLQKYKGFYIKNKNKYNFIRYPLHLLMNLFPDGYFVKKTIDNSKKYKEAETCCVGSLSGWSKKCCSKEVFDSFIELEFEGKMYPAPVGYDKWLRSFYGDYMQLPPKEKQVTHHRFEAYYKEVDK